MNRFSPGRLLLLAGLALLPSTGRRVWAAELVNDHAVTIRSAREVEERRRALLQYLWGPAGFPSRRLPDQVVTGIASPVRQLTHLARVDELRIELAPGLQGLAYHFLAAQPNRGLVIVHHGHACTLDDDPGPDEVGYGLQRTIAALLREGYGVLGVFMPHYRPGDCSGGHARMFQAPDPIGSPIRLFLEPVAVSLNYLRTQSESGRFPKYRDFHFVGLSGGGWTATVYAAIDPSIRCSFPGAGSIPLHLRSGGSIGDREQFEPTFYQLAGYPDLYVLGSYGVGRRQVQILVRRDDCCFGEKQHDERKAGRTYAEAMRDYARRVSEALGGAGQGSFRLVIDEVAPAHMISHWAINEVILPELRRPR
ncbi:MAG: hypothetical protein HZC55_19335 [Verrucomicrobia bacterium]|nr:hypothetical protein [Verrucomicrobiota bacterium]